MAASPWAFYNIAKKRIGAGDILLDAGIWKIVLTGSASNASLATLSKTSQLTDELAVQGGYVAGGRTLSGVAWTIAGGSVKFDACDLVFTASAADLNDIKYAIIHTSKGAAVTSGFLLCWSKLSTGQFPVTTNNTLTIQMAAAGIFTLT